MDKNTCSLLNCKYSRKGHEAEYFIYVSNLDLEKNKADQLDPNIYVPEGRIDSSLLKYLESSVNSEDGYINFINQANFEVLSESQKCEYSKIHFCRFHAPIESSFIYDATQTKKDIFNDASLLESFNQSIHDDINEWHSNNQKLLKAISATDNDEERLRISREINDLNLNAVCFPGDVDFSHHGNLCIKPYPKTFGLQKCRFEAKAIFRELYFDTFICDKTYFKDRIDFGGSKFRFESSFQDCIFHGFASLSGEYFGNSAYFNRSIFRRGADFMLSKFKCEVQFKDSIFEDIAKFMGASFEENVSFEKAIFYKPAQFSRAEFGRFANFDDSIFKDIAVFKNAKFTKAASYKACSFECCDFANAKFDDQLIFKKAVFKSDAFFNYADDAGIWNSKKDDNPGKEFRAISFENVQFFGRADFTNRDFLNITSFENTTFYKAPEFFNSVFHQGTTFSGARFMDIKSNWAEISYRTLKLAAESLNAKREEDLFFSLEQRSILYRYVYKSLVDKTKDFWEIAVNPFDPKSNSAAILSRHKRYTSDPSWIDLLLSYFYQLFSNYGRSIGQNLVWIIILILIFACFYFYCFHIGNSFDESLLFSLKQIFRPFFIYSDRTEPALGLWVTLLATLQTIVHLVLVTMLVFSVRRRLSIK